MTNKARLYLDSKLPCRIMLAVFSACSLLHITRVLHAVEPDDRGAFYTAGMFAMREKVISGECSVLMTSKKDGSLSFGEKWYLAFDQGFGRFRFNNTQDNGVTSQFSSDGQYNYYHRDPKDRIHKTILTELPSNYSHRPLDLRCIGLIRSPDIMEHQLLRKIQHEMSTYVVDSVEDFDDLVTINMTCHLKDGINKARGKVVLAKSKDFFPQSFECTLFVGGDETGKLLFSSNTTPIHVNNVWVPSHYSCIDTDGSIFDIVLNWKSVNESIPDDKFDWRTFELDRDTFMYNESLSEPFIERIVPASKHSPAQQSLSFARKSMLTLIASFMIGTAAYYVRHYYTKRA